MPPYPYLSHLDIPQNTPSQASPNPELIPIQKNKLSPPGSPNTVARMTRPHLARSKRQGLRRERRWRIPQVIAINSNKLTRWRTNARSSTSNNPSYQLFSSFPPLVPEQTSFLSRQDIYRGLTSFPASLSQYDWSTPTARGVFRLHMPSRQLVSIRLLQRKLHFASIAR